MTESGLAWTLRVPPWKNCPPETSFFNTTTLTEGAPFLWHMPLHVVRRFIPFDPYDDFDISAALQPKKFFTVIRDPYERMISLYYYESLQWGGGKDGDSSAHDAEKLNNFILTKVPPQCLKAWRCLNDYEASAAHFCSGLWFCGAQYDYVFEGEKRVVDHLVHFETLAEDFRELNEMYSLNLTVPPPKVNPAKGLEMTVANLSSSAIRLINENFKNDFKLGRGYEMVVPPAEDPPSGRRKS